MSHFVTHVIVPKANLEKHGGDLESAVEEILAPYDENTIVTPYIKATKAERIAAKREEIKKSMESDDFKGLQKNKLKYMDKMAEVGWVNHRYVDYLTETIPTWNALDDEALFAEITKYDDFAEAPEPGDDPRGYYSSFTDPEGNEWSTYNPNSQWDWWVIGGRWADSLKKEDGSEVNSAPMSEVKMDALSAPYALATPDGWVSKGQMGWFGFSKDAMKEKEWDEIWREYLEKLDDEDVLVVTDLHI